MKYDQYGCIIMEHVEFPGSVGDSCAETARYKHLLMKSHFPQQIGALRHFITEKGYIRHPDSPWRENDFSADQALPLYLALNQFCPHVDLAADEMKTQIHANGWKTGNGDLIPPVFYALLTNKKWLLILSLAIQALLFLIPIRWNDEKRAFESSAESSGDYLNWFHAALYIPGWFRKLLVSDARLMKKVRHYYRNEPNSGWVITAYETALAYNK